MCVSIPELSDTSREAKSDTWPVLNPQKTKPKEIKRRFSWENLTKAKDSKRTKSKRRHRKFMLPLDFSSRKSPSKSKATFKTSTPLKACENNFGSGISISQLTFNKTNSAQSTTCSDRLGVPKTSLNDFKRLLLNATNKKLSTKPSAVEQLKLKHDTLNASSPIKILDLSSSPKSFMNRRILQQTQNATSSPFKKSNLMSPRSRWKYNQFNKSSIASIPEANVEDDVSATDVGMMETEVQDEDTLSNSPVYATPQKQLATIQESAANQKESNISAPETPTVSADACEQIIAKTESSPETGIIETNFSIKENIFLQTEENNFMKGEIRPYGASMTKKPIEKSTSDASQKMHEPEEVLAPPTLETSF